MDILEKIELLKSHVDPHENRDKTSEVEVLLSSIKIGDGSDVTVYPANCPGKGRKPDILLDENGEAACMYRGKRCPHFIGSYFRLTDYTKSIDCGAV